jgi:hypothetical protein
VLELIWGERPASINRLDLQNTNDGLYLLYAGKDAPVDDSHQTGSSPAEQKKIESWSLTRLCRESALKHHTQPWLAWLAWLDWLIAWLTRTCYEAQPS